MERVRDHIQLLLTVARAYYEEGESQEAIAARIGYSRSSVSRLLTQARERGVVRFIIQHPLERRMALEKELERRFGLRMARVTEADAESSSLTAVARAAAEVLVDECRTATVLATSAGTTIDAVVSKLPFLSLRDLHVVQMIGSLSRGNPLIDSPEISRRVAERLGAEYRLMPAPLLVRSARLASALRREEAVGNALALASHADVALMGIGALDVSGASGPIFTGWLTPEESKALAAAGAVGHITGHHFDASGRPVDTDLSARIMAVPLDRLGGIRTIIGVAAGEEKVAAIRGAVRGGLIHILVTDLATARAVLQADTQLRGGGIA